MLHAFEQLVENEENLLVAVRRAFFVVAEQMGRVEEHFFEAEQVLAIVLDVKEVFILAEACYLHQVRIEIVRFGIGLWNVVKCSNY